MPCVKFKFGQQNGFDRAAEAIECESAGVGRVEHHGTAGPTGRANEKICFSSVTFWSPGLLPNGLRYFSLFNGFKVPSTQSSYPEAQSPEFVRLLTNAQAKLYACVCALLGGGQDARDVLQETNMVMWRKSAEYDLSTDFMTWAHRKKLSRTQVMFDDELLDGIAACIVERNSDLDDRLGVLDDCISKLSPSHRKILIHRYQNGTPIDRIATEFGQRSGAVRVLLHRIRLALGRCVQQGIQSEGLL
jgi:RNA polymerase sigma-70 factor, ECF subfamily